MTKIKRHVTTIDEIKAVSTPVKPEWIRLPQPGLSEPHFGLKRSKLNELILPCPINGFKPPVRSVCLRNKGQKKGVRLVSFDSLKAYLDEMASEQFTPEAA
jgi:hypothetical protein